jgi:hypothetical protein
MSHRVRNELALWCLTALLAGCGGATEIGPLSADSAAQQAPPKPGMIAATFVSTKPEQVWSVRASGEVLCQTPCTLWVDPDQRYRLRAGRRAFLPAWSDVDLPSLQPYLTRGSVRVSAEPRSKGKLVGGIVVGSVGAAGLFFGGMMALLGCLNDEQGLCTAGAVTTGAGAIALGSGTWLLLSSQPSAELSSNSRPALAILPHPTVAHHF